MHQIPVYVCIHLSCHPTRVANASELVLPIVGYCMEEAVDICVEHCTDMLIGESRASYQGPTTPSLVKMGMSINPLRKNCEGDSVEWRVDFVSHDQYVIRKSILQVEDHENE